MSLTVIRVGWNWNVAAGVCNSYQGQIHVLEPDGVFDEQLVLRHSGDFGGDTDTPSFEWYTHPADGSAPPVLPDLELEYDDLKGWIKIEDGKGAVELKIEGANERTLSDNWFIARYKGTPDGLLAQCKNEDGVLVANPGAGAHGRGGPAQRP